MKNLVFLSAILLWSSAVFAADTIKLKPDTDLVVYGRTDTTYTLRSVESTNPSDVGNPVRVYVPVESSYPDQRNYFLFTSGSPYNFLFDTNTSSDVVLLPLYLNSVGGPKYVKMAVKDGTVWKIFNDSQVPFNNVVNSEIQYQVSPADFCLQMTGNECTNFLPSVNTTGSARAFMTYVFFTRENETSLGIGATIDLATYPNGMYVEVNLSNQINPNIQTSITNVRQGDKRAFFEYTSNQAFTGGKFTRVIERPASTTSDTIGSIAGTLNAREQNYLQNSEFAVTDLVNGQDYNFSVFFIDNYNFTTKLSPTKAATPQLIEELLKKEACFLLTAGFGEEHYIIDYFRHFRDATLAKTYLGRAFISVYYELAPKYALIIYQHEALRATIRGAAYVVYFIMTNLVMILITLAFGVTSIYLYKNKEKIKV